jgi:hypothetical protein
MAAAMILPIMVRFLRIQFQLTAPVQVAGRIASAATVCATSMRAIRIALKTAVRVVVTAVVVTTKTASLVRPIVLLTAATVSAPETRAARIVRAIVAQSVAMACAMAPKTRSIVCPTVVPIAATVPAPETKAVPTARPTAEPTAATISAKREKSTVEIVRETAHAQAVQSASTVSAFAVQPLITR